jgi:hypothetical protein
MRTDSMRLVKKTTRILPPFEMPLPPVREQRKHFFPLKNAKFKVLSDQNFERNKNFVSVRRGKRRRERKKKRERKGRNQQKFKR